MSTNNHVTIDTPLTFYYTSPIMQWSLHEAGKHEYHIHLRGHRKLSVRYSDVHMRNLWEDIEDIINKTHHESGEVEEVGLEFDDTTSYIWVHVNQNKDCIDKIIETLKEFYNSKLAPLRIPQLERMVRDKLTSKKFFAESICHSMEQHGSDRTRLMLEVYFSKNEASTF